jgi:hypothetical protein
MHTILAAVLTALALTGCTTPATSDARQSDATAPAATSGRLPIAQLTAPTGPDIALSGYEAEVSADDLDDPADAAAAQVIDALADEGLLVTSIDTEVLTRDDRRAQVAVEVAHSPGRGHPIQSSYLLELDRGPGGWRIVAFSEAA